MSNIEQEIPNDEVIPVLEVAFGVRYALFDILRFTCFGRAGAGIQAHKYSRHPPDFIRLKRMGRTIGTIA